MDPFYDKIRDITEKSKTQKEKLMTENITPEEDERIDYWVQEMARHVEIEASKGKTHFSYDCSKIRLQLLVELSSRFKTTYPGFYVTRDTGKKWITVKWTGNYEV